MTKINSGSFGHGKSETDDSCQMECDGAQSGDPLIYNMQTGRFEPYSQSGNTSQSNFGNILNSLIGPPTIQLT